MIIISLITTCSANELSEYPKTAAAPAREDRFIIIAAIGAYAIVRIMVRLGKLAIKVAGLLVRNTISSRYNTTTTTEIYGYNTTTTTDISGGYNTTTTTTTQTTPL